MKTSHMFICLAAGLASLSITAYGSETERQSTGSYVPPMRQIDPATAEEVVSRAVFGRDDRVDMLSDEYPWSSIGYLWLGKGHCTGTLVGRDLVLTNAHCVHSKEGRKLAPSEILIFPTHKSGQKGIYSAARQIFFDNLGANREFIDEQGQYSDWALIRLNSPLGDEFGWMSVTDT